MWWLGPLPAFSTSHMLTGSGSRTGVPVSPSVSQLLDTPSHICIREAWVLILCFISTSYLFLTYYKKSHRGKGTLRGYVSVLQVALQL